jgi:hypothetical protein
MAPPEIKRSRTRNLQLATRNAFSKGEAPHGNSEKDEKADRAVLSFADDPHHPSHPGVCPG